MIFRRLPAILALAAAPAPALAATKIQSQTSFQSLGGVVEAFFNILIFFLPAVATIYLAIAGYRYIVAQGNQDLVEKAKKSLTYAAFGVFISYSAFLVISYLTNSLGFKFGPG